MIGIEACAGAHYWGRELVRLGHDARLSTAWRTERSRIDLYGGFPPTIASEDEVMGRTGQTDVGKA